MKEEKKKEEEEEEEKKKVRREGGKDICKLYIHQRTQSQVDILINQTDSWTHNIQTQDAESQWTLRDLSGDGQMDGDQQSQKLL
jgi:hypothetical protein